MQMQQSEAMDSLRVATRALFRILKDCLVVQRPRHHMSPFNSSRLAVMLELTHCIQAASAHDAHVIKLVAYRLGALLHTRARLKLR
jgi:hypothetical protein